MVQHQLKNDSSSSTGIVGGGGYCQSDIQYRKLAHQLFGKSGPTVNLSYIVGGDRPCHKKNDNYYAIPDAREGRKMEPIVLVERCLVCYSRIGDGECASKESEKLEFLKVLLPPAFNNQGIIEDHVSTVRYGFKEAVSYLATESRKFLCCLCDVACQQLLSKERSIQRLQQEVSELRQKIFAAVQLSMELTKKDSDSDGQVQSGTCLNIMQSVNTVRKHLIREKVSKLEVCHRPLVNLELNVSENAEEPESKPVVDWNLSQDALEPEALEATDDNVNDSSSHPIDIKIEFNDFSEEKRDIPSPSITKNHLFSEDQSEDSDSSSSTCSASSHDEDDDDMTSDDDEYGVKKRRRRQKKTIQKGLDWKEEGGTLYFKDKEVKINEDGRLLCSAGCPNRSFRLKSGFTKHLNQFHAKTNYVRGRVDCDICGANLCNQKTLNRHKKAKHLGIKPYACQYCDRKFAKTGEKIVHERSHTGERPFACHLCPGRFITRGVLNQHIRLQHSQNEEQTLTKNCRKPILKGEGAYPCDICGARLSRRRLLERHKLVRHFGVKAYACEHCGRKFGEKRNLDVHLMQHTGERRYKCTVCSEGYVMKRGLRLHMLSKHPEEANTNETEQSRNNEYVLGC